MIQIQIGIDDIDRNRDNKIYPNNLTLTSSFSEVWIAHQFYLSSFFMSPAAEIFLPVTER